jgi:hypothetical protein
MDEGMGESDWASYTANTLWSELRGHQFILVLCLLFASLSPLYFLGREARLSRETVTTSPVQSRQMDVIFLLKKQSHKISNSKSSWEKLKLGGVPSNILIKSLNLPEYFEA